MIDLVALARPAARTPLKHLVPGWFSLVLGWGGMALAWQQAAPLMGKPAALAALAASGVALTIYLVLVGLSVLRAQRYPQALADDLRHPVRHAFVAAVPISLLILVTWAVTEFGPATPGMRPLWMLGALAQFGVTLWVVSRWLRATPASGIDSRRSGISSHDTSGAGSAWSWSAITPVLFIPMVGNVVVPLAGVPLGFAPWSAAQFGVGLVFWPVLLVLLFVRLGQAGALPDRLLPSLCNLIVPPAISGSCLIVFGAPLLLAWAMWGVALFMALWVGTMARRITDQPFGLWHWGLSFPLTALAVLTLRLAATAEGAWLQAPAMALLALVSLVILGLSLATWRGLRDGSLLVPEAAPVISVKAVPG